MDFSTRRAGSWHYNCRRIITLNAQVYVRPVDYVRNTWLHLDRLRHRANRTGVSVEVSRTGRFSALLHDQDHVAAGIPS